MNAADLGRNPRGTARDFAVGLLLAFAAQACGGGAEAGSNLTGMDDATDAGDEATTGTNEPSEEFTAAYAVMKQRCSECHKPGVGHSFIVGSSAEATLSSATATAERIEMRITATEGPELMPPTGPLSEEELDAMLGWLRTL